MSNILNDLQAVGLNPFAVTLLAESLLKSPLAAITTSKDFGFFFPVNRGDCPGWAGARITLEAVPMGDEQPKASRDVLAERQRQISVEGYDQARDDEHVNDEIAALACFYAMPPAARDWDAEATGYGHTFGEAIVPQDWSTSTGDRRRELVKAGALILAEIERLDRVAAKASPTTCK